MAGILANLNKPEHAATIQKALGNNPDPTAIAKNVEMLKKKRIMSNYDRKKHVSNPQNQQRVAALCKANKEGMYVVFFVWKIHLILLLSVSQLPVQTYGARSGESK